MGQIEATLFLLCILLIVVGLPIMLILAWVESYQENKRKQKSLDESFERERRTRLEQHKIDNRNRYLRNLTSKFKGKSHKIIRRRRFKCHLFFG